MLRSKATAALMKLKEIDRKYKIKCSVEEVKVLHSSMSDISTIDSEGEILKDEKVMPAGSGDKPNPIITPRTKPKLDIRMPDAHMERAAAAQQNDAELVTIFNKQTKKHSPKLDSPVISPNDVSVSPKAAGVRESGMRSSTHGDKIIPAEKQHVELSRNSPTISEEKSAAFTESSISEDVPEVALSPARVPENIDHPERENTVESGDSIFDIEERVESDGDEDQSTLVASGMYSEDFVKSYSASKSNSVTKTEIQNQKSTSSGSKDAANSSPNDYQHRCSSRLDKNTESEAEEIVELIPAKVLRAVSECDVGLDASLKNYVKKIDRDVNEEAEDSVRLLKKSSQSFSARSGKEHRRKRRPSTVSSFQRSGSQSSKSPELLSSYRKRKPIARVSSRDSKPSNNEHQNAANFSEDNREGNTDTEIAVLFARKSEKESKNRETVSFLEAESLRKADTKEVSRTSKAGKLGSRVRITNPRKGTRTKDSSTEEPPPNNSSVKPSPADSVEPDPELIESSNDAEVVRMSHRVRKDRESKRPSGKRKIGDSHRSKHWSKSGNVPQCKKGTKDEDGPGDVDRLRREINELRLQQEKDQLRARVRCHVQQLTNEQRRLLVSNEESGVPIDQDDYTHCSATSGFRKNESLRYFFKPLDLPNVAAFVRPDFGEEQLVAVFSDLDNHDGYLHSRMVRERVLGIRHWLKQQFVLYRDYSSLVSTINAKYIPVTLKETKKMIRDMQRFYNNRESRRLYVR